MLDRNLVVQPPIVQPFNQWFAQRKTTILAISAAVASALIWAGTTLLSDSALRVVPPITLVVLQLTISLLVLWSVVWLRRIPLPRRWSQMKVGLAGLIEPGLAYTLGAPGLALTSASAAVLIGASEPVITLVLAWFFLRERLGRGTILLVGLAGIGLVFVLLPDMIGGGQTSLLGGLLALGGTLCASMYVIATRRFGEGEEQHPVLVTALQQSFGLFWMLVMLAGALWLGVEQIEWSMFTPTIVLQIVLNGILGYSLSYVLFLYALQHLSAGIASSYLLLIPVFGVLGASLFLGEQLILAQLVGGGVIVATLAGLAHGGR
jgi:drug/metabolite transporter (DMT)-like permease